MPNPNTSGDMDERRRLIELLGRLASVQPSRECVPDLIAGQWLHGDPDTRRKIEQAIDRMPKKKRSN
jgi:hypothetical protein